MNASERHELIRPDHFAQLPSTMLPLYSESVGSFRPGFDHQKQYNELLLSIRSDLGPQRCISNDEAQWKKFVVQMGPGNSNHSL